MGLHRLEAAERHGDVRAHVGPCWTLGGSKTTGIELLGEMADLACGRGEEMVARLGPSAWEDGGWCGFGGCAPQGAGPP